MNVLKQIHPQFALQRSDLKLKPNKGLSCLLSSVFLWRKSFISSDPRIKANLKHLPKSHWALLLSGYPRADKSKHSWCQLLGSAWEKGVRYPLCQLEIPSFKLVLTFSFHSFKLMIQTPSVTPWQRIKEQDNCKEVDYLLEASSRRRISGNLGAVKARILQV